MHQSIKDYLPSFIEDYLPSSEKSAEATSGPDTAERFEPDDDHCDCCNSELLHESASVCDDCAKDLDGDPDSSPKAQIDGYDTELINKLRDTSDHEEAAEIFAKMLDQKFSFEGASENIEVKHEGDVSKVIWYGGPFEWTLDLTGGETIGSTEFADIMGRNRSKVFPEALPVHVEPKNGSILNFYAE